MKQIPHSNDKCMVKYSRVNEHKLQKKKGSPEKQKALSKSAEDKMLP